MSEPRFHVHEHTGYHGTAKTHGGWLRCIHDFLLIDTLYNCRVVETFSDDGERGGKSTENARRVAERRCAQLNEWWRLELARG